MTQVAIPGVVVAEPEKEKAKGRVRVCYTLSPETVELVNKHSRERGCPRTRVIDEAVAKYFGRSL